MTFNESWIAGLVVFLIFLVGYGLGYWAGWSLAQPDEPPTQDPFDQDEERGR